MWTQCRECDKTSLSIHERGSEFLVTIGSFCQIWWGLHSGRVRWLVKKKKKASGFGFFFVLWVTCVLFYMDMCLAMYTCVGLNIKCVWLCVGMCARWLHLETVWDKLRLLGITWHGATCMPICLHVYAFVLWLCVVCTTSFMQAYVQVLKKTHKYYKMGTITFTKSNFRL